MTYVNQFSQHSMVFDTLIGALSGNKLMKGGVLVAIIWCLWFKKDERCPANREYIIATFFSCIVGMVLARVLALTLPFRLRPLHEEGLNFLLPYGVEHTALEGWSSFPSDHAVLFFALSTGLLFISRKVGTFALAYTGLFIAFPRIYLGLHYPTDIIAGAIIGATIAILGNIYLIKSTRLKSIVRWADTEPDLFYPVFFLFTYQIADMFGSSRAIISVVFRVYKIIFAGS
jgi:undecaprenyl-diphosphatase